MARSSGDGDRVPYGLKYGLTVLVLLAVTGALVVVVLPSRYALVADLRESGISFPTRSDAVAFPMPRNEPLVEPPRRAVAPPPSPIEVLWRGLDSLFARGDDAGAIDRMDAYLAEEPGDVGVRRERARALVRVGRPEQARRAFRDLVRRSGSTVDRLALARLERDAGNVGEAVRLYDGLLAERPDDTDVRHELARLYLWAGRYADAERELQRLVAAEPSDGRFRLDLARALYWSDRPEEARTVLAGVAPGSAIYADARALTDELDRLLAPPPATLDTVPPTLVERAREAGAQGDLTAARALYDRALAESPGDTAVARERIDFLQFRVEDLAAATAAIEEYRARFGLESDDRLRLAELYTWTGRYDEARTELEALVADRPGRADAWSLLGDVRRYQDDRGGAREAYARAMELHADDPRASAGLAELDRLRDASVASRAPTRPGAGPRIAWFRDSEDYSRLDLGGGIGWTRGALAIDVAGGYRRLEGLGLDGTPGRDEGGFASVEAARWWSEASLRTALRVGVDHLDAAGTEPTGAVSITRFGTSGSSVGVTAEHGPAYPHTYTLESAAGEVSADRLEVAAAAPLGRAWAVAATAEALRLSADAGSSTRWATGATLTRRVSDAVALDVGSRLVGFSDPAPVGARRLYWDPRLFWSSTVGLSARHAPERGLGARLRLSAGAALADERDVAGREWIPQLSAEGGLAWSSERFELGVDAFYRRSREDGYDAFGSTLTVRIRP